MIENTIKRAAKNRDLPDLSPREGEYFYTDGALAKHWSWSETSCCFVCGGRIFFSSNSRHVHAVAQCVTAGERIVSMFRSEACHASESFCDIGARVIVSACQRHGRNADILCRLTADGIITAGKISRAENSVITPEEFHEFVAHEARAIWELQENDRSVRNWRDSWARCVSELGHIPSFAERTACAMRLWEERKDSQAKEDWEAAEQKVHEVFNIAPIDEP